jgi:dolichol-phosphate mannosyltransferase
MYRLWEQGYEIIEGQKSSRGEEGKLHALAAKIFYKVISAATKFDMENASDFKLMDRKAVNVLLAMREKNAFFRALSSWIGFKTTYIEFDVQERTAGESKWSTRALTKYALTNITSFSTAPMQIVTVLGGIVFVISLIVGCVALVQKICGQAVEGFTTMILIQLFSSSVIMMSLGIMGYYIAQIYEEVKGRPRYIISDTCGEKSHEKTDP